jgi:hypothetical protein
MLFRGTWGKRSMISPEEEEFSVIDDEIIPSLETEKFNPEDEDLRLCFDDNNALLHEIH